MLTMNDTAAEAVKTIVSNNSGGDDGGVRISDTGQQDGFQLSVAPAPQPEDTVVDSAGARVFLDQTATRALDDRVLDAELGQDGSVRFALGLQG